MKAKHTSYGEPIECYCGHQRFFDEIVDLAGGIVCESNFYCKFCECMVGHWHEGHFNPAFVGRTFKKPFFVRRGHIYDADYNFYTSFDDKVRTKQVLQVLNND